jgi:hypothetical protein
MYRKLSIEERQARREKYRQNPIYRILYTPLWKQRGDDLSPEDVWDEANNLAYKLKSISSDNCKIIVAEEFDDLCERYSSFQVENDDIIRRTYTQAEHSAMMVSLTAFLLLANIYPEVKGHPYLKVCQSLTDVACNINGYTEIYEEARAIEDEYESHGEFIEVADFIEQIALRDTPLSSSEITFAHKVLGQIVDENRFVHIDTMKDNERIISRVSDMNGHCFQPEVDQIRDIIRKVEGDDSERLEYENIIFAKEYEDKTSDIRNAILPFVVGGVEHIDPNRQNQWLAIIEPLKIIDGLLITHEDKPKNKECTDGEICDQLKKFFSDKVKSVDFSKIPKSISAERTKWKERGVGVTLSDWDNYLKLPRSETKYKALANIAKKVYGEVAKVVRR